MGSQPLRVCVFCGGSLGACADYSVAARNLGQAITNKGATLVYGAGSAGLMGIVGRTVLDASGEEAVLGIVPEVYVEASGELFGKTKIVKTVEERKSLMMETSDVFVALPGGPGTLEEISAVLAWRCHESGKPLGLLNTNGYYAKLLQFMDSMVNEGFMKAEFRQSLVVSENPDMLLNELISQLRSNDD